MSDPVLAIRKTIDDARRQGVVLDAIYLDTEEFERLRRACAQNRRVTEFRYTGISIRRHYVYPPGKRHHV